MSANFERRPLTQAVMAALATVQIGPVGATQDALVGDGTMPVDSGWGTGDPNAPSSVFIPYFVLVPGAARPAANGGSMANSQEDWYVPYVIQSFGVKQTQAEWLADRGRAVVAAMLKEILQCGASKYRVQNVDLSQIGGVTRVPASDPPYYGEADVITLWMAKRRTP